MINIEFDMQCEGKKDLKNTCQVPGQCKQMKRKVVAEDQVGWLGLRIQFEAHEVLSSYKTSK